MNRRLATRSVLLGVLGLVLLVTVPSPALAQGACSLGTLNGAQTLICMPTGVPWNGNAVVFAHGYVAPSIGDPQIPWDQLVLPDGTSIPGIVTGLGFAFATTSYRKNGLAVVEGVEDVTDLTRVLVTSLNPEHVYLVGASEGGLVTTLAVEQSPEVFSGGLATCGPVGDFRGQVNYWGDFRVLFDYYFPGMLPSSAVDVPSDVQTRWNSYYAPLIAAYVASRPATLDTLLRVSRAPFDPAQPKTKIETVLGILWYNVFATNEARLELGGQPFDNSMRFYTGSGSDLLLNLRVKRYKATPAALSNIEANYQTSGRLAVPLVTMHTTGDPIVPYWHEPLYSLRALAGSGLLHTNLPILRYGHCSFKAEETLLALGLLVLKVEGRELLNAERVLATPLARERYRSLASANGLRR